MTIHCTIDLAGVNVQAAFLSSAAMMSEIAASGQHRYSHSVGNMLLTPEMVAVAPKIEMRPNPDFSFPRLPPPGQHSDFAGPRRAHGRPLSMMGGARPLTAEPSHKRSATQQLPSFSFNSSDHTGLSGDQSSLQSMEPMATPPSRHRRNVSELVGGVGMNSAISSSPTRTSALDMPPNPRGHRHRRSAAISSHDLSSMLATAEPQPRLSSSLPSTPFELPNDRPQVFVDQSTLDSDDPFGPVLENVASARPPSRRQVGFSENVEYIPRPLSTISSETESSLNTIRGHSVNNSISSVLSLTTPSPPASRSRAISLETTIEDEPQSFPKTSIEISRRVEREGEWLKHGTANVNADRPATASDALPKSLTFAGDESAVKPRGRAGKKHSASRSLGFDRRKSEPAMGAHANEPEHLVARLSALSLQETSGDTDMHTEEEAAAATRRSSTRKIKEWAVSKIVRKARPRSEVFAPREPMYPASSVAETNLDAVFNMDSDVDIVRDPTVIPQSQLDIHIPLYSQQSNDRNRDSDDGAMLDLDDALGFSRTPTQFGPHRPRKMLHSDRGTQDFMGPGAHYQPMHNRTASAPVLMAFDMNRVGTPPLQGLAVFDEEEEHTQDAHIRPGSTQSTGDEERSTGVSIVDQAPSVISAANETSLDEGLGIERSEWDLEPPRYAHTSSRLSTPILERRASSIVDQTIVEETSPIDMVTVVDDQGPWEEENVDIRAHSLTKSSDSSEAPTIMAVPTGLLARPDGEITPETLHSSAFSSPAFARRQSSFDTSRVGTSASSMTDNRTVSSCTTGEPHQDHRMSVDDVPSLTSSRSTMISTVHADSSRRDVSGFRTPSLTSGSLESAENRRRKRNSIQSLSQLMGGQFGAKSSAVDVSRPSTAGTETILSQTPKKKKEHRLKKLMFWKSKHRQASASTIL